MGPGASDELPLVTAEGWSLLPPDQDPWADERPDQVPCDPAGVRSEEQVLEVDTGLCGWASLMQPLRATVPAGAELELLAYHGTLTGTGPADSAAPEWGRMELRIGEHALWSVDVQLPAAAQVYSTLIPVDRSLPAGAPLLLHVHNHGANSWRFAALKLL